MLLKFCNTDKEEAGMSMRMNKHKQMRGGSYLIPAHSGLRWDCCQI